VEELLAVGRWLIDAFGPAGAVLAAWVGALLHERRSANREIGEHLRADVTATHELTHSVAGVVTAIAEMRAAVERLKDEVLRGKAAG